MTNEDNNVVEYEIEIEETENKIYQLKKKIDTKKEIEKIRKKKVKAIEDRNEYNEIIDIIDDIMIKKIKIKERKLNENFDNIRIKMDEKLKNRKIRKTFTLYYKTEYGAEVSGNGLSKGQRIKAHVQLSKYLKKAYGYDIPYMLDEGAELTYNIDYDTQVIIAYAKPKRLVKSDRSRWKDTDREKRIYLGLD